MAMVLARLDRAEGAGAHGAVPTSTSAAEVLGVDGITAGLGTGSSGVVLTWGAEPVSAGLEDLQFTLGQGPSPDAATSGAAVLAADLNRSAGRWPVFVPAAARLGVRAVFAFPLRIGAISVGVMTAHRAAVGELSRARTVDALALADAVTNLLLHRQSASAGTAGDQPGPDWAQPVTYRAEVHQATGMVSVQLGVGLAEALVRLRTHAWVNDRLLADVTADVVARRLRFDERDT